MSDSISKILGSDTGALSPEDLRHFALDHMVENNLLDLDLTWSEEEILQAMDRCRMMWDGIPPIGSSLSAPRTLPRTYPFLIGSLYQMYLAKVQMYMRGDIDYTIGGVQTNTFAKRIAHFQNLLNMLRNEFQVAASAAKEAQNIDNAYFISC